ncbi:hypothetical protein [Arthrobacter sp. 260]|uniref:hypothetical protein n=1 Tax=Arthrobacter sp. 260 TaxID=2735314 RepID=UPI001C0FA670|nr:hypothetical protein [Arthrobacter sp. 260]
MTNEFDAALILLREAGVRIDGGGLADLAMTLPDGTNRVAQVKVMLRSPSPSVLRNHNHGGPHLYIVQTASSAIREAAFEGAIDLIVLKPPTVILDGEPLLTTVNPATPSTAPRGPKPWGRLAAERILVLSGEPVRQVEIAAAAGMSQQATSKALKTLGKLVHFGRNDGWSAPDREKLIEHWLETYPGPGGLTSYWYGLDPVPSQARQAITIAQELEAEPLLSGDMAADLIAPWRHPAKTRIYLRQAVDFTGVGFSPATPEEATLVATIPADKTLWGTAAIGKSRSLPTADPVVVLWDLLRETGPDAPEAASHVRRTIIDLPDMLHR